MSEEIEKLTWRLEKLEEFYAELHKEHNFLKKELADISKIILQIKWLVIGALAYAVSTEFGIINIIRTSLAI